MMPTRFCIPNSKILNSVDNFFISHKKNKNAQEINQMLVLIPGSSNFCVF